MSDAIAMANYVANNVKVKVKLKKNVQNVKTVERNIYPKSVIRISLCRTAKRNPLIFPI